MQAFKVLLKNKIIAVVFYADTNKITREEVKASLVNHDGYSSEIRIVKERKILIASKIKYLKVLEIAKHASDSDNN